MEHKQNQISDTYFQETDLAQREEAIVAEIEQQTGFVRGKLLGRSSFWGSEKIGAFHYAGMFEGKDVVLKVQGIKPATSEIYMLQSFAQHNASSIIRPPQLYAALPWDEEKRYEALVMEDVKGGKVVSCPATESEVERFFELYQDYRTHCVQQPWVARPDMSISAGIVHNFQKWIKAAEEVHKDHPHRRPEDVELAQQAQEVLVRGYENVPLEFQHGHFSADDLYQVGDEVVLLSNLYWSWRPPLSDAVFAYHWYVYRLANAVDTLSPDGIDTQRALWLSRIAQLSQAQGVGARLLSLALLERETAGLVMDALTVEPARPISAYIMDSTRTRVHELIRELSSTQSPL